MPDKTGAPHSGAALLRRTSVLPQAKPWRRGNSLAPSISGSHGIHKNDHTFRCGHFYGAGEGNRTPVISLEGFCSTIELHPLKQKAFEPNAFVGNLMVEGDGFEPS